MKSKKINNKTNSKKPETESVSDIIAKSCGVDSSAYDPELCDFFSNTKYQAKNNVAVSRANVEPSTVQEPEIKIDRVGKKKKKTGLSHKDAAEIRVKAKLKSQLAVENIDSITNLQADTNNIKPLKTGKKSKTGKKVKKVKATEDNDEAPGKKVKKVKATEDNDEATGKKVKKVKTTEGNDKATGKKVKKVKATEDNDEATPPTSEEIDGDATESETTNTVAVLSSIKKLRKLDEDGEEKKLTIAELNTPKEDKNPEMEGRTVFVGNVPTDMTAKKLKKLFKAAGDIDTIRFRGAAPSTPMQLKRVALYRRDIHPDRNNIVAFIRYQTVEEAEKAVSLLNGVKVEDHHLTVDIAGNKKRDNKKAVFVGNLSLKLTDDELWEYFEENCGPVFSVRIVRDALTGMGRGFGYVNFKDTATVDIALKKEKVELSGRTLRVSRSVKKEKDKNKKSTSVTENVTPGIQHENIKRGTGKPNPRSESWKSVSKKQKGDNMDFTGDRTAEFGKLKQRKSNKPNLGDLKKARIAKKLTGHLFERQKGVKVHRPGNKRKKSQGLRQAKNKLRNHTSTRKEAAKAKISTKKSRNPNL